MGLLDRALVIDNREVLFSPDIDKMINSLNAEAKGLDFPSTLFSRIVKEFQITKGALLLPQLDSPFVPWAEIGFDRTTSRRIRIPDSLLTNIKNSQTYQYLELNNSEIEQMKEYLSFREYSVTKTVIIAPLFAERSLMALLVISEGEIFKQSTGFKQRVFEKLSYEAGQLLSSKRDSIINKLESITADGDSPEVTVERYINDSSIESFLLLSFSIGEYISFIIKKDSNALSFRIKQDILRLVKTLISDRGEVFNGGADSILILLKAARKEEAEMFVHQINLSLSLFFKITLNGFKPQYIIRKYPDDSIKTEELISNFL